MKRISILLVFGILHISYDKDEKETKEVQASKSEYTELQTKAKTLFGTLPSVAESKTNPYFHDGSVADLNEAIKIMGKLQLNKDLTVEEVKSIAVFLESLTGEVPAEYKM